MKIKNILPCILPVFLFGCAGLNERDKAVSQIKSQVAELRAAVEYNSSRLEDLNNRLRLLSDKVDAAKESVVPIPEGLRVVDVADNASKNADQAPVSEPVKPHAKIDKPEPAADPEGLYKHGQELFFSGKYAESREVFARLIKSFPEHKLSTNALYWMGESYYSERDFQKALLKFKEAAEKHPDANKAPDALLKAAYSCLEMNDLEKGREYLEKVINRYPDSEAAVKAKKTLKDKF